MILLATSRCAGRSQLIAFLDPLRIALLTCDNFAVAHGSAIAAHSTPLMIAEAAMVDAVDRSVKTFPYAVIVVGATEGRKVIYMKMGAVAVFGNDYVPELVARLARNLHEQLPRTERPRPTAVTFPYGSAQICVARSILIGPPSASAPRSTASITRLEVRLLLALQAFPRTLLPYGFLFREVWQKEYTGDTGGIRGTVWSLRKKFRLIGASLNDVTATVRGCGLRYDPVEPSFSAPSVERSADLADLIAS